MSDCLITTTTTEGLQTLGSAAQRSFELVTSTLRARLGDDAADLFAEPVVTAQGASTEWYTGQPGRPLPLATLNPDEATALRASVTASLARITALADDIAAQKTEQDFWLAEALRNATVLPDDAAIWAMRRPDGAISPVLVNWGRLADDQGRVRGVLTGTRSRPTPAIAPAPAQAPTSAPAPAATAARSTATPAPAAAASANPWPWLVGLGWLLLALLIALILWLMIAPCGLTPLSLRNCSGPVADATASETLRAEIRQLEARLASADRACLSARSATLLPPASEQPTRLATPDLRPPAPAAMERGADGRLTLAAAQPATPDRPLPTPAAALWFGQTEIESWK